MVTPRYVLVGESRNRAARDSMPATGGRGYVLPARSVLERTTMPLRVIARHRGTHTTLISNGRARRFGAGAVKG